MKYTDKDREHVDLLVKEFGSDPEKTRGLYETQRLLLERELSTLAYRKTRKIMDSRKASGLPIDRTGAQKTFYELARTVCPNYIASLKKPEQMLDTRRVEIVEQSLEAARKFLAANPNGRVSNPKGKRPDKKLPYWDYQKAMIKYIKINTGIELPPVRVKTFYEEVAKHVGL